jgi:glycosyltransferase involved in cell wall biosynthesis
MYGISVITASYNQGMYIPFCLESVEQQITTIPYEHIVVDAGSIDDTQKTVNSFSNVKLEMLTASSQSEAINHGMRIAKYPVICWLNSDDCLMQGAFERVTRLLDRMGERYFIYGDFYEIDTNGNYQAYRRIPPLIWMAVKNYAVYIPTSGSYFSRNVVNDGLLLNSSLNYLMDRDFLIRLKNSGYEFVHIREPLAVFRVHINQKSHKTNLTRERLEERQQLNRKHGGIYYGDSRILSWNAVLAAVSRVYISAMSRISNSISSTTSARRKYYRDSAHFRIPGATNR